MYWFLFHAFRVKKERRSVVLYTCILVYDLLVNSFNVYTSRKAIVKIPRYMYYICNTYITDILLSCVSKC